MRESGEIAVVRAGPLQALGSERQAPPLEEGQSVTSPPAACDARGSNYVQCRAERSAAKGHRFSPQLHERVSNHSHLLPAKAIVFFIATFLLSLSKHSTKGGELL